MPRSRKARNGAPPVPPGMTAKQIKRRRPIDASYMVPIEPATDNQEWMFNEYAAGKEPHVAWCGRHRKDVHHPLQCPQ